MVPETLYSGNLHLAASVATIAGSIVECGTWRGGMIAGIADVLGSRRCYYLCDSFQELPPAKEIDGAAARAWQADTSGPSYDNNCTASVEEARSAMAMSSAKDYTILKGWFEETLPKFPPGPIALLQMDADWYMRYPGGARLAHRTFHHQYYAENSGIYAAGGAQSCGCEQEELAVRAGFAWFPEGD